MKVALGRVYVNRTFMYLTPIVNTFPEEVLSRISKTSILAWGLYDELYLDAKQLEVEAVKYKLFIMHNPSSDARGSSFPQKFHRSNFRRFLEYIRQQPEYFDDYVFNFDRKFHITILNIPDEFKASYDNFLQSKFSQMYDESQLERLHIREYLDEGQRNAVYAVLKKKADYRAVFQQRVNEAFNSHVVYGEGEDIELDHHFVGERKEIFNQKNNKQV